MNHRSLIVAIVSLSLLSACSTFQKIPVNTPAAPEGRSPASAKSAARDSTVIYQIKEGASPQELKALAKKLKELGLKVSRKMLKDSVIIAQVEGNKIDSETLVSEVASTGAVAFAEPDRLVQLDYVPNDPSFSQQWHHININSAEAWNTTSGSATIIAASCDTGVDATHPDLQAQLLPGYNSEDRNTINTDPVSPHGTMTTGLIAATINNGTGVAGMANVKVLPIRASNFGDGSAYHSALAHCIEYAADHGAKVVNMSYEASSPVIDSAARYLSARGGLLIVSAGNAGADLSTQPDYASFLLVGATDSGNRRASWSNYGTPIDLVAPGVELLTTYPGAGYAYGSGTSFSAPLVSGVAALVYSLNPAFTSSQVSAILLDSVVSASKNMAAQFGKGRLNAAAAVKLGVSRMTTKKPGRQR
jgi:subtilisin family serine protease